MTLFLLISRRVYVEITATKQLWLYRHNNGKRYECFNYFLKLLKE